jgi:hypothetical protein
VAEPSSPHALVDAFERAVGAGPADAAAIREQIGLAERQLRLLRVVLSSGRSEEAADVDPLPMWPEPWAS